MTVKPVTIVQTASTDEARSSTRANGTNQCRAAASASNNIEILGGRYWTILSLMAFMLHMFPAAECDLC